MELVNEFVVHCPVEQAWSVLTDVELVAPCLPGAQLTEVEGDVYRGVVRVKVGPIVARFAGQARFVELDEAGRRAVLDARGKESTGKGLASATVTAQLHDEGGDTRVTVTTDLTISGRLAQFGRGTLADVSAKLLTQFADRLEQTVLSQPRGGAAAAGTAPAESAAGTADAASEPASEPPSNPPAAASTPPSEPPADTPRGPAAGGTSPAPAVRVIDGPEAEPVDLLREAGAPVLKRLVPLLVVLAALAAVLVVVLT
jgi:uncharacterized protein